MFTSVEHDFCSCAEMHFVKLVIFYDIKVNIFGIQLQNENLAVGSLIILFCIGFAVFCKADEMNKARTKV